MDFRAPDGHAIEAGTAEHVTLEGAALTDMARQLTASGSKLTFVQLAPVISSICAKPDNYAAPSCNVKVANDKTSRPYNTIVTNLAATIPGVSTISITGAICPNGVCVSVLNGILIRFDGNHFTTPAAEWLAPVVYRQLVAVGSFQ